MNELKDNTLLSTPSKTPQGQQVRWKKIVNIRRLLARKKYDVDKRLNIVINRIFKDLINKSK